MDDAYALRLQAFHLRPHGQAINAWIDACLHQHVVGRSPVLDYGCGTGSMARSWYARGLVSVVDGYDPNNAQTHRGPSKSIRILSDRGSIRPKYRVIVCTSVLGHVPNPVQLIAEFKQRLYDGGLLILTIPSKAYEQAMTPINLLNGYRSDPTLIHRWYAREIIALVESQGLVLHEGPVKLSRRWGILSESQGFVFKRKNN